MTEDTPGLFICATLEEGQQAAAACQQWMKDHVSGYSAQIWDQPRQRDSDGKFSIYIDFRVFNALTPDQQLAVEDPNPADVWGLI